MTPNRLAPIDLAALGERIAAMATEAASTDPTVLRRRVAQLQQELTALRNAPPKPSGGPAVEGWCTADADTLASPRHQFLQRNGLAGSQNPGPATVDHRLLASHPKAA